MIISMKTLEGIVDSSKKGLRWIEKIERVKNMVKCECGAELKICRDEDIDEDGSEHYFYCCPKCGRTSYYPGFY